MPLPRFSRLPEARRRHILDVARAHLARDGAGGASYNQIIADAGISKTSAYLYFDGKDDLVGEVRRDLGERLREVIGTWPPTPSTRAFWARLELASRALHDHLRTHTEDLALLGQGMDVASDTFDPWFAALVADGVARGVVRRDVELPLLVSVTRAVFEAADAHALARLARGEAFDADALPKLLRSLWQPAARRSGR